jgi:hypothetical protein
MVPTCYSYLKNSLDHRFDFLSSILKHKNSGVLECISIGLLVDYCV